MKKLLFLFLSLAVLFGLFYSFGNSPRFFRLLLLPQSPATASMDGLNYKTLESPSGDPISIGYDELGVPHIFAKTDIDAAYATGFAHARDRLFQLEMLRRTVMGRLTEVAGMRAFESDRFWRKFQFTASAKQTMEDIRNSNPMEYEIYRAYANGINDYVSQMNNAEKPIEFFLLDFEPTQFEPWHCMLLIKYMSHTLTYREDDLKFSNVYNVLPDSLVELYYPYTSPRTFPIYPDLEVTDTMLSRAPNYDSKIYTTDNTFPNAITHRDTNYVVGSNNWVVHASKSATGNAFLCNDTHLGLRLPSTWYEVSVVSGDRKRRGLTIPGAPFIVSGFNEYTAWGMTNATWDLTDFYRLDINKEGDAYALDDEYAPLEPFVEKFAVKGGDTISYTYYRSFFGPVDTIHGEFLATQWVAEVSSNDGRAFFELQQSTNIDEAFAAVHYFMQPTQNFVLADNQGNVGLATSGLAMRNRAGQRGIIRGITKSVKSEYYPTHDILNSFNPERGWIASANQQHISGEAGARFSTRYAPSSRGRRIAQLMEDQPIIDRNYLHQMHMDVVDLEWEWMSPKVLQYLDTEWKVIMSRWDGKCDTSSVEATFFIVYKEWVEKLFESEFSTEIAMYPQEEHMMYMLIEHDTLPTLNGFMTSEDILSRAVDSTFAQLTEELGEDPSEWKYADVHKTTIRHVTGLDPLSLEAFGSSGSNRTVNVAGGFPTTHGPSMRTVIELTPDGPVAELMITGGQSGRPNSENYADQIDNFRSGTYHSAPLDTGFNRNNYSAIIQFNAP